MATEPGASADPMTEAIEAWQRTTDMYVRRWQEQLAALHPSGVPDPSQQQVTSADARQLLADVEALLIRLDAIDARLAAFEESSAGSQPRKTKKGKKRGHK